MASYKKLFRLSVSVNLLLAVGVGGLLWYYDTPRAVVRGVRVAHIRRQTQAAAPASRYALLEKLGRQEPGLIVAFGNSVTEGWMDAETCCIADVYHQQIKERLHERFPHSVVNVINAGFRGDTLERALKRVDRDVLRYEPDLVTIEFGLNDCIQDGADGVGLFRQRLYTLLGKIRAGCKADIILVTPNFMATADNPNVAEEHRKRGWIDSIVHMQRDGELAAYVEVIREVGADLEIPVADVYARWQAMADAGDDTNALLANGLNHPCAEGHRIIAEAILAELMRGYPEEASEEN